MNLYQETLRAIQEANKVLADIVLVGNATGTYAMTWVEFTIASDVSYDARFGSAKVAQDLVIVFKDNTWLNRTEYDGGESWQHNVQPKIQGVPKPINNLFAKYGWETVSEIMEPETNGY